MIEISGLYKSFGKTKVLEDINLFIQKGEIFGIIGKSGAGKSTLLRTINLLAVPDQGSIAIDGENITAYRGRDLRQLRHRIAMVFQDFNLLNTKTVAENIALPMRIQTMNDACIKAKIDDLLTLVELDTKALAYPQQLSGGQKQRVAIARALACNPSILLCDEATSALDPQSTEAILALLKKINSVLGITIVLITHEMDVIKRICHRLSVMDHGRIIETTSLADAFSNPESTARHMLYKNLSPKLPTCLTQSMNMEPNDKPILRLFFQGRSATVPFISQTSRDLHVDINILLANIDRYDTITCGVLIVELTAPAALLEAFIARCKKANLTVEIIGYAHHNSI